ncbi:ECF transporter S component [Alkalibaculum sp. M08DMB]|uniref:ECF transporter S component n=1 Tax=Alkalibaculum sporogenes TaxID=2655001 RepID=A0A6A7KBL1_9FIRM|nr:ECF transporter S component [Alkalibaculum sporogenes]MPW26940.1 ECF transporter S component [Alkalibaculum sporogenes]
MDTYLNTRKRFNTKTLVYLSLLIALSFVGAQIKVFGSIALDALPAFFAALFLGPVAGAIVGAIGHLLTAMTSGFQFTVLIHILIALCMAGVCWVVGFLNGKINLVLNCLVGILLNGVVATYISVIAMQYIGIIPSANIMFMTLIVPLSLTSTFNVVVAAVIYKVVKNKVKLY